MGSLGDHPSLGSGTSEMDITFICLANSRKLSGRCVAGLRTDGGGWIRPVSQQSSGTLLDYHYILDNKDEAHLLDIIEIGVSSPRPEPHQPENWVLDKNQWKFVARLELAKVWPQLRPFLITGPDLLGNQSDRVIYAALNEKPAPASLALIEPSDVSWVITESYRGNRQTRVRFQLGEASYDLAVTDPKWEQQLSHLSWGTHPRQAADISGQDRLLFTVSLGEPFSGECFKLVAAVIVLPAIRA